jgi:hypothetical protein
MHHVLSCCVCGVQLTSREARQVGYSLAGWPGVLPVSLFVCSESCGQEAGRVARERRWRVAVATPAPRQMRLEAV